MPQLEICSETEEKKKKKDFDAMEIRTKFLIKNIINEEKYWLISYNKKQRTPTSHSYEVIRKVAVPFGRIFCSIML